MTRRSSPGGDRPPLDQEGLERLALHYVGRYATTRARLEAYLVRKLRERGGAPGADAAAVAERMEELRYVDDAAWAEARAGALGRRGYGPRRVSDALRASGIDADLRAAVAMDEAGRQHAALALARRKRLGPFASARAEGPARQKAIAALARAGHDLEISRKIVDSDPGALPFDPDA